MLNLRLELESEFDSPFHTNWEGVCKLVCDNAFDTFSLDNSHSFNFLDQVESSVTPLLGKKRIEEMGYKAAGESASNHFNEYNNIFESAFLV